MPKDNKNNNSKNNKLTSSKGSKDSKTNFTKNFMAELDNSLKKLETEDTEKQELSSPRGYRRMQFDLCQTGLVGEVIGRPIRDAGGRLYREVNSYGRVSYPIIDSDGEPIYKRTTSGDVRMKREEILWMGSDNYVGITSEQRKLNDELGVLIQQLNDFKIAHLHDPAVGNRVREFLWVTYLEKLSMMFMKVRKVLPVSRSGYRFENTFGWVSIIFHRWKDFGGVLDEAVAGAVSELSPDDLRECFSRDTNTSRYVFSITTTPYSKENPSRTYEAAVKLGKVTKGIFLNRKDLEVTTDLTSEYLPVTFDEAQIRKNIDSVRGFIADICQRTGFEVGKPSATPDSEV